MWRELRILTLLIGLTAPAQAAPPPLTYLDDAGTRFLTVESFDGGRVGIALRTVGGPGAYGRWLGTGQQTPKGIEFSQKAEDGAPTGAVYLAAGGQSRLVVKLKPGQAGAVDAGLSGNYHHVTDEKIAALAKKDFEAAEKKLDESIKAASHKAPAEDKPAYAEWKKAWPELRDRLSVLSIPKPAVADPQAAATRVAPGPVTSLSPEKQAAYWVQRAETTAAAANLVLAGVPPGLKSGWEGNYEDGFGGSMEIFVVSNGDARFTLNAGRGPDGAGGTIEGRMPASTIKTAKDGTSTGEFTDNNTELKEGEQQTRLRFRRIGHFILIESQYAQRYAGSGWFDGIYIKRLPPKVE